MHFKRFASATALLASVSATSLLAPAFAQENAPLWGAETEMSLQAAKALKAPLAGADLASEAVLRDFSSIFPDLISIQVGEYTPEGSGTVAHDVRFTLAGSDAIGLKIGEVRMYGLNEDFAAEIAAGDASQVAARIDLRDVAVFGLETIAEEMTDTYMDAYEGVLEDLSEATEDIGFDQGIHAYDMSMGHVILDGFVWHPASEEVKAGLADATARALADDNDEEAAAWMVFGNFASFNRSIEIADVAVFDTRFFMDMSVDIEEGEVSMNEKILMDGTIDLFTYANVYRGDTDRALLSGINYAGKIELSSPNSPELPENGVKFDMSGKVDLYDIQGMRLEKLFSFLERQEVPGRDVTDLMSVGKFALYGEEVKIADRLFYSVDKAEIDLSEFHWFAPERLRFSVEGLTINLDGYLKFVEDFALDFAPLEDPELDIEEFGQVFTDFRQVLNDNGAGVLDMDFVFDLQWDAETGATRLLYDGRTEGFGAIKFDMDVGFLNLDDFIAYSDAVDAEEAEAGVVEGENGLKKNKVPDSTASDAILEAALIDHGSLNSMNLVMEDEGGLEKIFSMIIGFAQLAPEGDEDIALLQGMTPETLRVVASSGVRMLNIEVASAFPPAVDYVNALADFLQSGGKLEYGINPEMPISAASEGAIMENATDPQALLDYLGVSVTYTPPAQ